MSSATGGERDSETGDHDDNDDDLDLDLDNAPTIPSQISVAQLLKREAHKPTRRRHGQQKPRRAVAGIAAGAVVAASAIAGGVLLAQAPASMATGAGQVAGATKTHFAPTGISMDGIAPHGRPSVIMTSPNGVSVMAPAMRTAVSGATPMHRVRRRMTRPIPPAGTTMSSPIKIPAMPPPTTPPSVPPSTTQPVPPTTTPPATTATATPPSTADSPSPTTPSDGLLGP